MIQLIPIALSVLISDNHTPADILRSAARQELWSSNGLPTRSVPDQVEKGVQEPRFVFTSTLSVDRLTFIGEYGFPSVVYHYKPTNSNGRLLIYHEGHGATPDTQGALNHFLDKGYTILFIQMPLFGPNAVAGYTGPWRHDLLAALWWSDPKIIRIFMTPIAEALNYALANYTYFDIGMTGLSGGAWATTLYAALDTRIRVSAPVAGSVPLDIAGPLDSGDFEQQPYHPLYIAVPFEDLYFLASAGFGRRQIQMLNEFDSCCFSATGREAKILEYSQDVDRKVLDNGEGGSFSAWVVKGQVSHEISDKTLDMIDDALKHGKF